MPKKIKSAPTKQFKTVFVEDIDVESVVGSPDEIIKIFQALKERTTEYKNVHVEPEGGYDGIYNLRITGSRPETDEELSIRLRDEAKWKANDKERKKNKTEKERKEFERLKKKYG